MMTYLIRKFSISWLSFGYSMFYIFKRLLWEIDDVHSNGQVEKKRLDKLFLN